MAAVAFLLAPAFTLDAREHRHDELPLRIAATIVNTTGVGDGRNSQGVITITRWTTPDERERLRSHLARGGSRALLLSLLHVPSHGQIRIPGWQGPDPHKMLLGWDLRYAWREPDADGGSRVVLGTDRYISLWEERRDPHAAEYPFTVVELRLDRNGEGAGKASVATKINFNPATVMELENYEAAPELLLQVKVQQ